MKWMGEKIEIRCSFNQAVKFGFCFGLGLFLLSLVPWAIFLLFLLSNIQGK